MHEPILERDPSDPRRREINPLLKLVLELGPLIVFFFANARGERLAELMPALHALGGPIFVATGLFMVATASRSPLLAADCAACRSCRWSRASSCSIFGGADALAARRHLHQDEADHRQRAVRRGAARRPGLRPVAARLRLRFGFKLDAEGWRKLTLRWGLFFFFLAVLNEFVWRTSPTDTWVAFKVWGIMPITLLFTLSQMPLIMRHSLDENVGK